MAGLSAIGIIVYLAVVVFYIATLWRIFEKANEPGWAAIIPIYNTYILLKIVNRPGWWLILLFIPVVDIVVWIIVTNDLSKSFNHGTGFTFGLLLLGFIFYPMLAFGESQYTNIATA
ncbi:MAG: DUF5684 domain-containing protein [Actinobacteria bacterium]|nr:DUF5684 domain-containing protein [Actinomycetota bacterium]MCL6105511.1 DUF5684 domain-containing protein [Actinomycetota bacterium]